MPGEEASTFSLFMGMRGWMYMPTMESPALLTEVPLFSRAALATLDVSSHWTREVGGDFQTLFQILDAHNARMVVTLQCPRRERSVCPTNSYFSVSSSA